MNTHTNLPERWTMDADFGITWEVKADAEAHFDEIEMSGRKVSLIVRYGVDENGLLLLTRRVVWPTLRTIPNNTHASLWNIYDLEECSPLMRINGIPLEPEKPRRFRLDGFLQIESQTSQGLTVTRTVFPSSRERAALEKISLRNDSSQPVLIAVSPLGSVKYARGTKGVYLLETHHDAPAEIPLAPGEERAFGVWISGRIASEAKESFQVDTQEAERKAFIQRVISELRFECPDPVISRLFDFAKLRATESIFETARGLMHGPGGGAYYAATWCNDQCEYANPFFPFLGDEAANESALNCYRQYMPFMADNFSPIPSSIVAEGLDIWEGAGDRGDAAMYAYGASRYALALGDPQVARELFPAIDWCLEYCERQKTSEGVIASDSDELEGRFSHGKTNLATSSLTYGALRSASAVTKALGLPEKAALYEQRADALSGAIDRFFAANLSGYETYRYHEGLQLLRSWICLPMVMGIFSRRTGTVEALFSPPLWKEGGIRTQEGDDTFWDRSTLYALRGIFFAGETGEALTYFTDYSHRRLLGEHVPYPVETYHEGNQRHLGAHLAAESALYCRVITEGIFGINPTGFDCFDCTPHLPLEWDHMELKYVHAFGSIFNISITREEDHLTLRLEDRDTSVYTCNFQPGETVQLRAAGF